MLVSASSSEWPCDQQPGSPGHETENPSSVFTNRTLYFMIHPIADPPSNVSAEPRRSPGGRADGSSAMLGVRSSSFVFGRRAVRVLRRTGSGFRGPRSQRDTFRILCAVFVIARSGSSFTLAAAVAEVHRRLWSSALDVSGLGHHVRPIVAGCRSCFVIVFAFLSTQRIGGGRQLSLPAYSIPRCRTLARSSAAILPAHWSMVKGNRHTRLPAVAGVSAVDWSRARGQCRCQATTRRRSPPPQHPGPVSCSRRFPKAP